MLEELRDAVRPAGPDRVIPLSPYQVNQWLQALAERAGFTGVSSPSGRRLAVAADGRALRLGRRRRGRRRGAAVRQRRVAVWDALFDDRLPSWRWNPWPTPTRWGRDSTLSRNTVPV